LFINIEVIAGEITILSYLCVIQLDFSSSSWLHAVRSWSNLFQPTQMIHVHKLRLPSKTSQSFLSRFLSKSQKHVSSFNFKLEHLWNNRHKIFPSFRFRCRVKVNWTEETCKKLSVLILYSSQCENSREFSNMKKRKA
jgi:hypothetical protein